MADAFISVVETERKRIAALGARATKAASRLAMQHAILVSEHEWQQLLADVQALKASRPATPPCPRPTAS